MGFLNVVASYTWFLNVGCWGILYQVMGQFHDSTKQLESSIAFWIFRNGDLETRMVPIDLSFPSWNFRWDLEARVSWWLCARWWLLIPLSIYHYIQKYTKIFIVWSMRRFMPVSEDMKHNWSCTRRTSNLVSNHTRWCPSELFTLSWCVYKSNNYGLW